MTTITLIGGGNMAAALIGGLTRHGTPGADIRVVEIDPARCAQLGREFGVQASPTPATVAGTEVVVLAVKPQQMQAVCMQIRPWLGTALVLSIAAGIRAADIARWLGSGQIVRAMPNTPALIGLGISGVAALPAVTATQRNEATAILSALGRVVWFDDEHALDAVTAVSGSGPAYVYYFIEALIEAGGTLGLTAAQARELAIHTFVGAAQLAADSTEPIETLRERVTSKGGTTAAALASLEHDGVKAHIATALQAAARRAEAMGAEFGAAAETGQRSA